jgi:DNA polymerase/3'-5' exonuclease PolX
MIDTVADSDTFRNGQPHHGPPAGGNRRPAGDRRRRQLSHPQLSPRRRSRRANHRGPDGRADTARLLEIPGIGKGMAANLQAIAATGTLPLREELLAKYGAGLLELLKLPGMGPKTVALLWSAAQIASIDQLAEAIEAGRLAGLPRMGEKQIEKLRKGIDDYRRSAGRFRIDVAEEAAQRISAYLLAFPGLSG